MKIAFVTNSFPRCRLELFERLARKNEYQITIFKYADWWDANAEGIEIKRWRAIGFKLPFMRDDTYFHFDYRVLQAIMTRDWDVVIAYGYGSFTTWIVAFIARLRGIPFILWSDARLEYELQRSRATLLLKRILHRMTAHFIASGTSTRLFFEHMEVPLQKITIVPYAIDNQAFFQKYNYWKERASDIRVELGIPSDAIVVLYVGRLVKEKGLRELLQAFRQISVQDSCNLLLVGDGRDRNELHALAKTLDLDNVIFMGKVDHDLVARYYAVADIFVLPSYKDVWALVINEAMVCGLPVITTAEVGAWRDIIRNERNGFLIPSQDIGALQTSLLALIKNSSLLLQMGNASQDIIASWSMRIAQRELEALLSVYSQN